MYKTLSAFHSMKFGIKYLFKCIKWAWQRAIRGYSDQDLWNLDSFYLHLIEDSLNAFAKMKKWGYPDELCESEEEWSQIVRDLATHFHKANLDNWDNPYEDDYHDSLKLEKKEDGTYSYSYSKELARDFREVEESNWKAAREERRIAFKELEEKLDHLWD